jgi:putative nucleotidyltransferase with HDIG domain
VKLSRLIYRFHQFWNTLPGVNQRVKTENLLLYLSPSQVILFRRMQRSEQFHAFRMLEQLKASGQTDPDLLAAALLHDVGKALYPLSIIERAIIVLGNHFFLQKVTTWSEEGPNRLRRPFFIAAHHPEWGAELAKQAGASLRTVELIRRHQEKSSIKDPLLAALQAVDNEN